MVAIDVVRKKLACPMCKGTQFEVFLIEVKNFFPNEIGDRSLCFIVEKCLNCGWLSNETDREKIRERLVTTLLDGFKSQKWRSFIIAKEDKVKLGEKKNAT